MTEARARAAEFEKQLQEQGRWLDHAQAILEDEKRRVEQVREWQQLLDESPARSCSEQLQQAACDAHKLAKDIMTKAEEMTKIVADFQLPEGLPLKTLQKMKKTEAEEATEKAAALAAMSSEDKAKPKKTSKPKNNCKTYEHRLVGEAVKKKQQCDKKLEEANGAVTALKESKLLTHTAVCHSCCRFQTNQIRVLVLTCACVERQSIIFSSTARRGEGNRAQCKAERDGKGSHRRCKTDCRVCRH